MKIKDLEKKLRKENESIKVPDVYSKVKQAPINHLLTGETPVQAFKKKLAMRLLIAVAVLLAVSLFALAALAMSSDRPVPVSDTYCSVSLTTQDGTTRYGLLFDSNYNVKIMYNESSSTVLSIDEDVTLSSALASLYVAHASDEVFVCAHNDRFSIAQTAAEMVSGELKARYVSMPNAIISFSVNDNLDKMALVQFINSSIGEDRVGINQSISELSKEYLLLAALLAA